MSPVPFPGLEQAIKALGKAFVLVGDPFTPSGMSVLGLLEGEPTVAWNEEFNDYTLPEYTGPMIHERKKQGENPVITLPMIIGDAALMATLSADASLSGGGPRAVDVTETALVLVPEAEFGTSFGYDGTGATWSPAAPEFTVWLWRGHFQRPDFSFVDAELGKRIFQVTYQAMPDRTLGDDQWLYYVGDPVAAVPSIALDF